jgi:L-alanine-DL-glutamate epimerase-like enolase superfamily enzyme
MSNPDAAAHPQASSQQIAHVAAYSVAYPEPNDNHATRYLTFCRIEARDGTVGWGEAITQSPESARATALLIEGLEPLLVGRNPLDNVALWGELQTRTWWYGYRGGLARFALSAIDIALWDLKGRLLGLPLVTLLGGAHRERLPVIASTHVFDASLEAEAERHGRYVREEGYQGVKVGMGKAGAARLGYEIARDVEFVRLLREAIGPDAMLMMDRGQSLHWTFADALRRTKEFERFGLTWIEEPFEPTDVRNYRALRAQVGCLVAGGEREWDERGYREAIGEGVLDVVGCDVGRAGGITGALEVIKLVEINDLWFNSHAWSSAINTAASIALSAVTPRCLLQELKPDRNPMQDELVLEPFSQSGGFISVPLGPGLGIEVDEGVVERYRLA